MKRGLTVTAIAALSAACTTDATTIGVDAPARDSAGVEIVNIASLDELPTRALAGPVAEIPFSGPTADASIGRLGAAIRLADGRIVVADGGSHTLKVFDSDGDFSAELGVPGEIIMARKLWQVDGAIVGYDGRQRRVSTHSLAGGPASFWTADSAPLNSRSIGRLDSGEIVLRQLVFDVPEAGFDTTRVAITLAREGASILDTVGQWKSSRMGRVGAPPAQLVTSPIFEPRLAAAAREDRIVLSDCREPEIRSFHVTEGLQQIVRWAAPVESVTEEDVRLYRLARLEGLSIDRQRQARQMLDAKTVSLRLPVCDDLRIDPAGGTWLRLFARPGATHRRWLVFAGDGRPLFSVDVPASSIVVSVGEAHLVILEADSPAGNRVSVYAFD